MKRPGKDAKPEKIAEYMVWEMQAAASLEAMMGVLGDFAQLPSDMFDDIEEFLAHQRAAFEELGAKLPQERRDAFDLFDESFAVCKDFWAKGIDLNKRGKKVMRAHKAAVKAGANNG